jgi:hypothetical protein
MFSAASTFTPYKAKLILLPALLESGQIKCLYEHLTEATENSNHECNMAFQNHSTGGGGYVDRNVCSSFVDLFQSFMNAVDLGLSAGHFTCESVEQSVTQSLTTAQTEDESVEQSVTQPLTTAQTEDVEDADDDSDQQRSASEFFKKYLAIVKTPVPTPQLDLLRCEEPLRGLNFEMMGNFTKTKCKDLMPKVTQESLEALVNRLGGTVMNARVATLAENYSSLQHSYIVLQDDTLVVLASKSDRTSAEEKKITGK